MTIRENLEILNFSKLEADIYLALLGEKPMSAYQLAKKIDISRTSIYNALEFMLRKGMVEVVPNETLLYIAQEPNVIFQKMQEEMTNSIREASRYLAEYQANKHENITANFYGYDTAVSKTKELFQNVQNEVYINTDCSLEEMRKELEALVQRGIRVILFSFYEIENPIEGVSYFSHGRKREKGFQPTRFMIVADNEFLIMADGSGQNELWKGTESNEKLLVKLMAEHIHNDIYLLKIRDKYGKEIYDDYLKIDTIFERKARGEEA